MGKIVVVTSLKGGVGKTVFSAGFALQSALVGKQILAVDMDLGTGGLDIAMGREDEVAATLIDFLTGAVAPENALFPGADGVYFLSAPVFFNESSLQEISQERFNSLLRYLKDSFDCVLFDMPAGGGSAFSFFEDSGLVDEMILVTTPAPTAIRAAERCAMRLKHPEKLKLLINAYHIAKPKDNAFGVMDVIYKTSVPIIGVVPFDAGAEKALVKGIPLTGLKKSPGGMAIANITGRIYGEKVPLFRGIMPKRKRSRYY